MITICCKDGESILQACQNMQNFPDGVCGGNGICGKCKVRMISGIVPASGADEMFFSKEELRAGWRLACIAKPQGLCEIEFPVVEKNLEDMVIVSESIKIERFQEDESQMLTPPYKKDRREEKERIHEKRDAIFMEENQVGRQVVIVDIGTTTVAMQILSYYQDEKGNLDTQVVSTYTGVNSQRRYGADVLSRIQAANEGRGEELKQCILQTLLQGLTSLAQGSKVGELLITGNTTMVHLLMGYSCATLGRAPFKPFSTQAVTTDIQSLFAPCLSELPKAILSYLKDTQVFLFPSISAFVGGDVVAGLYYTGFYKESKIQLLVDIGTNGEMVIGNRMRILATSVAAGSAFEGGGLSCGCAGIKGAIWGAELSKNGTWKLKTIGDEKPIGICGSGIVDILYELLQNGLMDETGLLVGGEIERVDLVGQNLYITQQDIRQFQMSKAAIRAGVETLIKEYGVQEGELSHIYIAGGFGYFLNLQKATAIGLFPYSFLEKMRVIGNSALGGLRSFALSKDQGNLHKLIKYTGDCPLAENSYFQEKYIESMYFCP